MIFLLFSWSPLAPFSSSRHNRAASLPRYPDPPARLDEADNLGLGLVILGLLPWANGMLSGLKMIFIWLLVQFAGATVAQLIARAVRQGETQA